MTPARNDSGQVAGYAELIGRAGPHAFLYSEGVMQDLGTFGGYTSYALDINSLGQAVGHASTVSGYLHAFLYSEGVKQDLGTLIGPDRSDSYAYSINDSGQVVGASQYNPSFITPHAFLYSGGVMQDLGTLGGIESVAYDINNSGQVVGYATITSGARRAFLYRGGAMTNLNNLIPPDSGWVLVEALGINDAGQIVGKGVINDQVHGFLLTPVTS